MSKFLFKSFILILSIFGLFSAFYLNPDSSTNRFSSKVQAANITLGEPGVKTSCPQNGFNVLFPWRGKSASIDGSAGTYAPDVACGCRINQCRLSTATNILGGQNTEGITSNLQFICINGSSTNSAPRLSREGTYGSVDLTDFQDTKYWKSVAGAQGSSADTDNGLCPSGKVLRDVNFEPGSAKCCRPRSGTATADYDCETIKLPAGLSGDTVPIYYLDIFSADTTKQVIPVGATCRTSPQDPNGVAYWYYPGYFDVLQGKTPSDSTNILVGNACTEVLFSSVDLFNNKIGGTQTFFGCLPNSINGVVAFIVRLISGLSIFIAFLIVLINLLLIVANSNNSDAIAEYQKKMFAGIYTAMGILLTVTILSIFGVQIIGFGSEGIGGGLFRFFVGG